ncbi:hypothetical protein TCAL_01658 [Tigriopus californicus]|uniref:RAD50-interacting protein 1 n=1 Tax=Tigriopus californicus TaxID=6832 RepID=A0A553PCA4_TIGCA|nr:RAD50-interacting protein 1-like [Tigriopus californicus]TRY75312.1 hypothetical protein TCAL_01658 [Tigriopus californicus]|eukprot:TCALIF_01658-PA protein Name:"Similar to Rint1 RAD50-interacting protein 1 (Mus musculus)" AED:0.01 eAED:0.01 QI:221/1/1/1/1/1/2/15/695
MMSTPEGGAGSPVDWPTGARPVMERTAELVTRLQAHTQTTRRTLARLARPAASPSLAPPDAIAALVQGDGLRQWMGWSQWAHALAQAAQDQLRLAARPDPSVVQPALRGHPELDRALVHVSALCALDRLLESSACAHLRDFVRQNIHTLGQSLVPQIQDQLARVLADSQYPDCVLSETTAIGQLSVDRAVLGGQFQSLWALAHRWDGWVGSLSGPPVAPCDALALLLQPLTRRFQYHFSGAKKTNSLVRPEWYLQQVKLWLERSRQFLDVMGAGRGQTAPAEDSDWNRVHPRLCQGLFGLIQTKLQQDLPVILEQDLVLSHAIDEMLLFTQAIQDLGFDVDIPVSDRPIAVLEDTESIYLRWLQLEQKYAFEKIEAIILDEEGWQASLVHPDVLKCVDSFVTLLQSLTTRFQILSRNELKLKFVILQCELLEDFRMRLVQILKLDIPQSQLVVTSDKSTMILNSADHIVSTIEEWTELPFFLRLQSLSSEDLFLKVMDRFRFMIEDNCKHIGLGIAKEIRSRSEDYRHPDHWLIELEHHDRIMDDVSVSALGMFQALISGLDTLSSKVKPNILHLILDTVAKELSDLIVNQVILTNVFSRDGIDQLALDVSHGVVPIFRQFGYDVDRYPMKKLGESVRILQLPKGEALLLVDTLRENANEINAMKEALADFNVHAVYGSLACIILERRLDVQSAS